jgi:hypothetical protein
MPAPVPAVLKVVEWPATDDVEIQAAIEDRRDTVTVVVMAMGRRMGGWPMIRAGLQSAVVRATH